jgi:7-cyano-7-deazaguanine synthase in queuosine biosynthesis
MKELFHFDDNWKNIGIKLSGGADSSIILYAICDYFKDNNDVNIYAMTLDTKFKPWYSQSAKKVIDKVFELTGKSVKHIVKYSDLHYSKDTVDFYVKEQNTLVIESNRLYNFDCVYSGLTSNPPEDLFLEKIKKYYNDNEIFKIAEQHIILRDFNRDIGKNIYSQRVTDAKYFLHIRPFVEGDKTLTYEAYKYYSRLDDLYPISYSCETRYQEHKLEKKQNHDWKHCGYCFFCAERIYAFGKLE